MILRVSSSSGINSALWIGQFARLVHGHCKPAVIVSAGGPSTAGRDIAGVDGRIATAGAKVIGGSKAYKLVQDFHAGSKFLMAGGGGIIGA